MPDTRTNEELIAAFRTAVQLDVVRQGTVEAMIQAEDAILARMSGLRLTPGLLRWLAKHLESEVAPDGNSAGILEAQIINDIVQLSAAALSENTSHE
jgi:hypothetical protein